MNKVMLIGNLGKDPDVRYLDSGVAVATFSIATTERGFTAKSGAQVPDRTDWHNIVLWRGLAETAEKYLKKGDKIYVKGKMHTRSYDDQQGIRRSVTEIYVDNMEMLTPKGNGGKGLPPEIPGTSTAAQTGAASPINPEAQTPVADDGLPFPPAYNDFP